MPIRPLYIHSTNVRPEVDFRYIGNAVSISGTCDPGSQDPMFTEIKQWLDDFDASTDVTELEFRVDTNYIGSTSLVHFREMFIVIGRIAGNRNKKKVAVVWRTEATNTPVIGYANTLKELLPPGVPFQLLKT